MVELTKELSAKKENLANLEEDNNELTKQIESFQSKVKEIKIQKEESDTANKKVIQNLKDKIKSQNEKITDLQKRIIEMIETK